VRRLPRRWWTLAWLDREEAPILNPPQHNFTQVYKDERVLLEDLAHGMRNFNRGAYVAAAWEGALSPEIAKSRKPKFYVWRDGHVQTLT
jgi:hypothetical protein